MEIFGPDWSRIHHNKSSGIFPVVLGVFSVLYGAGVKLRLQAYREGIFRRQSLPGFVVSIGNLTVGGTGKTPAVVMLSRWAIKQGFRVAVLSRGYGGRHKSKILEVSDGSCIKADQRDSGDEPYLLARKLSGVPVVISEKRYAAGLFAREKFKSDFFILDDGFQHLELRRNLDLVLIDAERPFGNGHLLPRGPLREPVEQLARADACIITRCGMQDPWVKLHSTLRNAFPEVKVFCADHLPKKVDFPFLNETHDPGILDGKKVVAFAGIARPEVFKHTLDDLGAETLYFKGFKDHYKFRKDDVHKLIHIKEKLGACYIITTEKDWVRMAAIAPSCQDMAYLCIEFELLSAQESFFRMIKDGIKQ